MKKVLILGANSYIGTSFQKYVKENHPDKFAVDTVSLRGDAWQRGSWSDYDSVINVTGKAHVDIGKLGKAEKKEYYDVNVRLACRAAKKAKADGAGQYIYLSSIIIYGDSAAGSGPKELPRHKSSYFRPLEALHQSFPRTEGKTYFYTVPRFITPGISPAPSNFYGDSKWKAEQELRKLFPKGERAEGGTRLAILRLPMVYGEGCKGNYQALRKLAGLLPVFPDYRNRRSMLYIGNLCEFLCLLVEGGEGGLFFPQDKEYVPTSEMVRLIAKAHGRKVRLTGLLNPMVHAGMMVPGRIGGMTRKAFGSLTYEKGMSRYPGGDYQRYTFWEGIRRTEAAGHIAGGTGTAVKAGREPTAQEGAAGHVAAYSGPAPDAGCGHAAKPEATGCPASGAWHAPKSGATGCPAGGAEHAPKSGATGCPASGAGHAPKSGATGCSAGGAVHAPKSGATGCPASGAVHAPKSGATGCPASGARQAPKSGATGGSIRISVITVTYNSAQDIAKTLESMLAQGVPGTEYWIIDGKSRDRTVEIAESYRTRMEAQGIAYHIISEPDGGIYDAMNKGIRLATGDVIGILNSGDWYEPYTLKVVRKTFREEDPGLMFGNIRIFRGDGSSFVKKARQRWFQTSRDWNHPTTFVKAELYKEYPFLDKGIHDDYGFYLRMRKLPAKIVTVDKVLANFRLGGASNEKNLKTAGKRIMDRYRYCYRANGYSRWYILECVAIEAAKLLLG